MIFLGTTRLREFWPNERPLTLLGRWCLDQPLESPPASEQLHIAPYPWDDRSRFLQAAADIDALGEQMLPWLADWLNEYHRVKRSTRYWRIRVGPWLSGFLDVFADRYVCIEALLARDSEVSTIGLEEQSFYVPSDTADFIAQHEGDAYNLQLYTRVLSSLDRSTAKRPLPPAAFGGAAARPAGSVRSRARRALRRVEEALARRSRISVVGAAMPHGGYRRLLLPSHGEIRGCDWFAPIASRPPIDRDARAALSAAMSRGSTFERAAGEAIGQEIPLGLLEGGAPSTLRRAPSVILSGTGWSADDSFKQFAAEAQEAGTFLAAMQHGGAYGMLATHPAERHEQRVADVYYSAGWTDGLDGRVATPMPAPFLQAAREAPRGSATQLVTPIVLVTTVNPRYLYRMQSHASGPQWADYIVWQRRFVSSLSPSCRARLVVRLYPHDYGWRLEDWWHRHFPDVKLQRGTPPLTTVISQAALTVIDHPSTTMLEVLSADQPHLMFWDERLFNMRAAAEPALDQLRAAGILSHDPELAAAAVDRHVVNVDGWWRSPAIREATDRLRRNFARASLHWPSAWCAELQSRVRHQP